MIGPPPTPARRLVRQQRFQPRPLVLSQVMTIVHGDDLSHPTQKIHGTRPNIGKVAAAWELIELIFYGLRDGHIRCLNRCAA